ncbi:MAG TPA: ATP-binding protein, partial [Croceibacterium sp.]|nr:ATP-binding protein [Croceibacterium sp.]
MTGVAGGRRAITADEWRQIVDSAVETAIITTDLQGRVQSWSEGASRILGWSEAEMIGQTLERLFPEGTGAEAIAAEMSDATAAGRGGGVEGWRIRKDGSRVWSAGEMTPIRDSADRITGFTKVLRDRSNDRKAEEAVLEERRTLAILNRAGSALSVQSDLNKLVQVVTDAGVELTGAEFGAFFYNVLDEAGESYTLYALSGAPMEAFSRFPMLRNTQVFAPTFSGEGIVRSDDITADPRYGHNAPYKGMPDGHLPVRSYLAVPVISRGGEVLGGLFFGHAEPGVFTERSEQGLMGLAAEAAVALDNFRLLDALANELEQRRHTEARLKELNDELEERVEAEIARRAAAEEALRQAQKMEAVGQLTGGIAHDFNNLLTVVTGNVGRAQRAMEAAGFDDPRTERSLENALKGAERAAALTQRLLAFSRRQPLAPKAIDLDRLVAGMSDLLQRALGEMVRLEIVTNPGLWGTEADPNQLESAILNLALNARDAMPNGGELVIETANVQLDEGYAAREAEVPPGQYVMVAVTDTGTGMSPEIVDHAFEPFFTTKEVGKGTGLGLSMVYGFVKQSGGHVKIYSEEGHGTTIKVYLPRLLGDHMSAEPRADRSRNVEGSPRQELVLVVEDDDDVRAYTIESMQELGYRVLEAHDGPSALRQIRQQEGPIDLLFTDVVMPGMSGRELAEEARLIQPSLRVLYTSGYTRNAIVHGGRLDPGVEMIMKPFTFEALAAKVRDMIDNAIGSVLLVEADPTLRKKVTEKLSSRDVHVELAATAGEALAKVRAAQGQYGAVVLDDSLTDRPADILFRKMRALYSDLPV